MIYARSSFEGKFEVQSQKEQFRQVSQEWHRFLGFRSAHEGAGFQGGTKRKRSHWEAVNQEMQEMRWKQLKYANVQAKLEMILGPGAQFRGKQKPAIEAIMQGHSPIMVIMGTGSGKSMLFMLPAACVSGGTTIVIVPLVALQGDLQARCEKAQIPSIIWSSQRPYESASIIFVTPESAVSKTFAGTINRLQELRQLERFVIDECHTISESRSSFRPKLKQLGELAMFGVQMVYLTATLPPRDEDEFHRLMHIPAVGLQLFRDRTTRKNIRYQVQEIEVPEPTNAFGWKADQGGFDVVMHEAVLQLVQQKLGEYPAPAKMIIYCSSIKGAEGLSEALGCEVYHRNIDSFDGKARRLHNWRNAQDDGGFGQGRVIVATNALGLGVDVADIRVVIHVGKVWALKDYAQESGRAGRDGDKSEAIIMRGIGAGGDGYKPNQEAGMVDIEDFVAGQVCRRVILDQVMDAPRPRNGCEEGEVPCDVCHPHDQDRFQDGGARTSNAEVMLARSPPVLSHEDRMEYRDQVRQRERVASSIIERRRREGGEIRELVEYLEEWCGKCPICHLYQKASPWHDMKDCPMGQESGLQMHVQDAEKGIRYEDFSCCFYCGVPQGICDRWEQIQGEAGWWSEKKERQCQYFGVLILQHVTEGNG